MKITRRMNSLKIQIFKFIGDKVDKLLKMLYSKKIMKQKGGM